MKGMNWDKVGRVVAFVIGAVIVLWFFFGNT